MKDTREFLPDPGFQGLWKKNKKFTGNKWPLLQPVPVKLIVHPKSEFLQYEEFQEYLHLKTGDDATVTRFPDNLLRLKVNGEVIVGDAKEGVDFA